MNHYVIRLGSRGISDEVDVLLDNAQTTVTVEGIYNYEYEISQGDLIFFYLGGIESVISWTAGLRAVGKVARGPYDRHYGGSRNYRLDVERVYLLSRSIEPKESKIHPRLASRLWDVSFIGARHFPNQAISRIWTEDEVRTVFELIFEMEPQAETVLRPLFPPELLPQPKPLIQVSDEPAVLTLLNWSKQVILYGPPGTGKTFLARSIARHFDEHRLAQFHPSYSYEDFIGGIRPVLSQTATPSIQVEEYKGVLQEACNNAASQPDNRFLLIIDEINRGNIASIFGELILAIEADLRGEKIPLSYLKGRDLSIPPNLYILGTMNSADRSIALVDIALRRRFSFYKMAPDYDVLISTVDPLNLKLNDLLRSLNKKISAQLGEDYQLGHTYLLSKVNSGKPIEDADELGRAWFHTVLPLLEEYFRGDLEQVAGIIGNEFFISDQDTQQQTVSRRPRLAMTNEELLEALRGLVS